MVMSEQVLVIPAAVLHEAGMFHGFSDRVSHYLPRLLEGAHLRFMPRDEAEVNEDFKQLIPYVVLRHNGQVFHYTRGGGGGEKRLHAMRSIGIGGHISLEDGGLSPEAYRVGMRRELAEEVELPGDYEERCVGLINDDRTPVGRVHLGVVHVLELLSPEVRSREAALVAGGFAPVAVLREEREAFETWSQFLLDAEWLG
jgi:predicted NUDIX family phosphoesterase